MGIIGSQRHVDVASKWHVTPSQIEPTPPGCSFRDKWPALHRTPGWKTHHMSVKSSLFADRDSLVDSALDADSKAIVWIADKAFSYEDIQLNGHGASSLLLKGR